VDIDPEQALELMKYLERRCLQYQKQIEGIEYLRAELALEWQTACNDLDLLLDYIEEMMTE
jgi:hypothetical protein